MHIDAFHNLFGGFALATQSENVNMVAPFCKRGRIAQDAIVGFIKRVGNHSHPQLTMSGAHLARGRRRRNGKRGRQGAYILRNPAMLELTVWNRGYRLIGSLVCGNGKTSMSALYRREGIDQRTAGEARVSDTRFLAAFAGNLPTLGTLHKVHRAPLAPP